MASLVERLSSRKSLYAAFERVRDRGLARALTDGEPYRGFRLPC